jgi:hypothetical protein
METSKSLKPKSFVSRLFRILGLFFLFTAILLVYIYAGFSMVYFWIVGPSPGPGEWFDHVKIELFFNSFDELFRMKCLLIIIGVFMLSLFFMLIHNKFVKKKDVEDANETVIIHDDIIQVKPEVDEYGNKKYKSEDFISKKGFYTMEELFKRKGTFRVILKIMNYFVILAILAIVWTFYRTSSLAFDAVFEPYYLATDEAYLIITSSVIFLLIYYLLRCPDFVKSLAATGFKRVYIRKLHLHETFLGILLTIGGLLLVIFSVDGLGFLDRSVGLFFIQH